MAIKWKSKILLAAIENVYGTDATPTGANAIFAKDISLMPQEGSDLDRELEQPNAGNSGTLPVDLHTKITFQVELAPSGTAGTAPGWGPLMRACRMAEVITPGTSVAYNGIFDDLESITLYLVIGNTLYAMTGARGNVKIEVNASGIPYLSFEFTSLFSTPVEVDPRPTPDLTGFQKPQAASQANTPTFTIDGTAFVMRSFSLDLGNAVEPRFLIGEESIVITDHAEIVETTVVAVPVTSFDPFTLARDQTEMPISLVHGTGPGRISTLSIPQAQIQRVQGLENAQNVKEWPLRFEALPAAGNDEFTLTLT